MRFAYVILPLLSAVAIASDLVADKDKCESKCPQVKCKDTDPDRCQCINNREKMCKKQCPDYTPQYVPCTPEPPKCPCEPTYCIQVYPQSCYCDNAAKQKCYDDCGGPKPQLEKCPPLESSEPFTEPEIVPRAPEVAVAPFTPETVEETPCECDQVFCILSFPEGCYCQNDAAKACEKKCSVKAKLQDCSVPKPTFTTKTKTKTKTKTPKTSPTPAPAHKPCGGGRANQQLECAAGETCIRDPFVPGCGPACDQLGICVKDKICDGFAGFACPQGQTCVDDERDDCDPKNGGADCAGLCVTPH